MRFPGKEGVIHLLLGLVLAVLALFQYRWLGQVSAFERTRLHESMGKAGHAFADDFDREIAGIFTYFHALQGKEMPETVLSRFQHMTPHPDLVKAIYKVRPRSLEWERLDFDSGEYLPSEPAAKLAFEARPFRFTAPDVPALIIPSHHRRHPGHGRFLIVVILDLDRIESEILPELARRHFGSGDSLDFQLSVIMAKDPDAELFAVGESTNPGGKPDGTFPLFSLRPFEDLHGFFMADNEGARNDKHRIPPWLRRRTEKGGWLLLVRHRDGSLEEVVARARMRNMAISFGILLILSLSLLQMARSTSRERDLARRQVQVIAGISHEICTPLAAISSAAENLADGVVVEPARVKRYGEIVKREASRLASLVDAVTRLGRTRSLSGSLQLERRKTADLLRAAVEHAQESLDEATLTIRLDFQEGLPDLLCSQSAIFAIMQNLLDNSAKYGARKVDIIASGIGRDISVAIRDDGPGISPRDLPHLFEPFYRGASIHRGEIPGSGLGLALVRDLVEAQTGSVRADAKPGGGTTITITLQGVSDG